MISFNNHEKSTQAVIDFGRVGTPELVDMLKLAVAELYQSMKFKVELVDWGGKNMQVVISNPYDVPYLTIFPAAYRCPDPECDNDCEVLGWVVFDVEADETEESGYKLVEPYHPAGDTIVIATGIALHQLAPYVIGDWQQYVLERLENCEDYVGFRMEELGLYPVEEEDEVPFGYKLVDDDEDEDLTNN